MSKSMTTENILTEVSGDYNEDTEMTVMVHGQKMDLGRYAKKFRELKKLDKDFDISSKNSQNSHKSKGKREDWDD